MGTKLRAVKPDEKPVPTVPKTLAEASERSRREFLVSARLQITSAIDGGVPPHALGRLIAEADRLDAEIRRLDALQAEEVGGVSSVEDGEFKAAAI